MRNSHLFQALCTNRSFRVILRSTSRGDSLIFVKEQQRIHYTNQMFELPLISCASPSTTRWGGKASNLIALARAGISVLPGILIGTEWFHRFQAQSIGGERRFVDENPVTELATHLRSGLKEKFSPISGSYILRSSASIEGKGGASCSGLFDSILLDTADDLEHAIEEVWKSASDTATLDYIAKHYGIKSISMALLFQPVVTGRIGGTIHTRNTETSPDGYLVEYSRWRSGAVVDGSESPSTLIIPDNGREGVLDDTLPFVPDLIATSELIAAEMRLAVEIEWVVDTDGQLWILQAREL
jgi:phosphoenolpyruvate synthase/pyruvate phosphate dikinase